jgi:hypothetical protein
MPRTAARVTQADIARALRAIEASGSSMAIEILPDGVIRLVPVDPAQEQRRRPKLEPVTEIVL